MDIEDLDENEILKLFDDVLDSLAAACSREFPVSYTPAADMMCSALVSGGKCALWWTSGATRVCCCR